jgi:16S rRNA (guanine527-N7)-methyltransferase
MQNRRRNAKIPCIESLLMTDDSLPAALARHQIALTDDQTARVEQYCRLLWDWNQKLNLTRHTDFERIVARDLVDCLELSQLLQPHENVLDIGTGGGVPGLVLALLRDDLRLTLTESVGKKAVALESIVREMGLDIEVLAARAEHRLGELRFDTLTSRAVGPLWKILKWLEPHWDSIGRLLTVKGPRWVDERGEARHRGYLKGLELRRAAHYPMVGTSSESVILQISGKNRSPTPPTTR